MPLPHIHYTICGSDTTKLFDRESPKLHYQEPASLAMISEGLQPYHPENFAEAPHESLL